MNEPIQQFTIVLEPTGPLGNVFFTLAQAVETAQQLEEGGHHIRAIKHGAESIEGDELRLLLGEPPADTFIGFPRV